MPTATSTRLSDKAKLWITQALRDDNATSRESVIWEVAVAVFPDPSATDLSSGSLADPSALAPLPALVIYLEIPGAEPDTSLYIAPIVPPFQLTRERVGKVVAQALKTMRTKRQELLDNPLVEA